MSWRGPSGQLAAQRGRTSLGRRPTGRRCRTTNIFQGRRGTEPERARAGGDRRGACASADRGDRIAAGTDGRAQGTTATGKFGAEGVRDLRSTSVDGRARPPTELERLAAGARRPRRLARAPVPGRRSASRTPRTSSRRRCPRWPAIRSCPPADGARRNYLRRALWRDALDELRHRHGRDLRDGARELVPLERRRRADRPRRRRPTRARGGAGARPAARRGRAHARPPAARRRRGAAAEVPRGARARTRSPPSSGITRTQYERRLAARERARAATR